MVIDCDDARVTQPKVSPTNPYAMTLLVVALLSGIIGAIVTAASYEGLRDDGFTGARFTGAFLLLVAALTFTGWAVASAVTWREQGSVDS